MQSRLLEQHISRPELIPAIQRANGKTYLFAICSECGRKWNISAFQKIPKSGYICPYCRSKHRKQTKAIVKWGFMVLVGVILFLWGAEAAYIQRGYKAYGGEYLLLFLPILAYLLSGSIKDTIAELIKIYKTEV